MFLELLGLGKKSEQRIAESLTELLWELYSVVWVEELPNRNCFGIDSVIVWCVMVIISAGGCKPPFVGRFSRGQPMSVGPANGILAILHGINSVHTRCIVKTSGFTRGV